MTPPSTTRQTAGREPKPYYQDDMATLYHGDCRDVLPTLGTVDLIVTDPPYGIAFQSNRGDHAPISGDRPEDQDAIRGALAAAFGRLRVRRHAYVFGPFDLAKLGLGGAITLVWDKENHGIGATDVCWSISHELIQFGVAKYPGEKGSGGVAARLRRSSVLRVSRLNSHQCRRHPTEKPVPLLRDLIESSSMIGECVLDPFAGVGSTLVASKLEGRHSIGIEIEEAYCRVAAERLAAIKECAA